MAGDTGDEVRSSIERRIATRIATRIWTIMIMKIMTIIASISVCLGRKFAVNL
jgi:hypothetical protein